MNITPSKPAAVAVKYRPSMTSYQITKILELAKLESEGISPISMSIIATLAPFQAKIENAGIQASYTPVPAKPSTTSLEALGAASAAVDQVVDKEEYWALCYERLQQYGATELSLVELQAVAEHRYLNDLMTTEEESEHESTKT